MIIDKIDKDIYETLIQSVKNYIRAWHKIPHDIDVDNLNISRIRYIKEWRITSEDGFIIEYDTDSDLYRELLGRSELGLTTDQYKILIKEQNENGLLLGKDIVTNQGWYEYPVVFGSLDEVFDDVEYYQEDGKYVGDNYLSFGRKYE